MKFEIKRTSMETPPHRRSWKEGNKWFIEIDTLEDLMEHIIEEDKFFMLLHYVPKIEKNKNDSYYIEIYDDYRE